MTSVLNSVSLSRTLRRKRPPPLTRRRRSGALGGGRGESQSGTVTRPPRLGNAAGHNPLVRSGHQEDEPMWGSRTKLVMPSKDKALPGRSERMRVPAGHFVNRHTLTAPFPDG